MVMSDGENHDERQQKAINNVQHDNETGFDKITTLRDDSLDNFKENETQSTNKSFEDFSNFSSDQISDCGDDNDDYDDEHNSREFSPPDEEDYDYDQSEEIDNYDSSEDGEFTIGSSRKKKQIKPTKKSKPNIKRTITSAFGKSHRPSIKFKKKKKSTLYGSIDYGDTTTEEDESDMEEEFNEDDYFYKYVPADDDDDDGGGGIDDNDDIVNNISNNISKGLDINKFEIRTKYTDSNFQQTNSLAIDKVLNFKFGLHNLVGKKLYQSHTTYNDDDKLTNSLITIPHKMESIPASELENNGLDSNVTNEPTPKIEELCLKPPQRVMQFLIKWKNKSYLHCTWESEQSLKDLGIINIKKLQNFCQENNIEPSCTVDPVSLMDEHSQSLFSDKNQVIDDVLEEFIKLDCILAISPNVCTIENVAPDLTLKYDHDEIVAEGVKLLCHWYNLPHSDATWEDSSLIDKLFPTAITEYFQKKSKMYYQLDLRRMGNIRFYKVDLTPDFIAHCNCDSTNELQTNPLYDSLADKNNVNNSCDIKDTEMNDSDVKTLPEIESIQNSPPHTTCNVLRDYQLEGVNWMTSSFCKKKSIILADEMGLGKTVQVISFISTLFHTYHINGPFLIVVPLSTVESWRTHFKKWAPDLIVISYTGNAESRRVMRSYNFFDRENEDNIELTDRQINTMGKLDNQSDSQNTEDFNIYNVQLKFHVFITTYEMIIKDKEFIGQFDWVSLIVDEAHRLKNEESSLYLILQSFYSNHRLLMTGTPLQNNLRELWCILHFILPDRYQTWDDFEMNFSQVDPKSGYIKLQKEISPYILRRMKKDVEKSLPPKIEQILRVEMTKKQKDLYKCILTKNYTQLSKELKCNITGFLNVMMELKKCCNHTALITHLDFQDSSLQDILRGSGKMILLDKLLERFKKDGSRVLIFSQMIMILDILSSYLIKKNYSFQRLDGSVVEAKRKQAMNEFNAEGSKNFCFLLSTRAGGLGINLVSADVVIIFDSDWNPQNDLQAQARAHRIGQTKTVKIYRLVTKGSVDETIVERAKKKMVLDHLVIQTMSGIGGNILTNNQKSNSIASSLNKKDLSSIIKFGAEELFKEEDDDNDEELQKLDIDKILSLAEEHDPEQVSSNNNNINTGGDLLSSFKVANFKASDFDMDDDNSGSDIGPTWDDIIPESDRKRVIEEEETERVAQLYLPPRRRSTAPMIDPCINMNLKSSSSKKNRISHSRRSTRTELVMLDDETSDSDVYNVLSDDQKKRIVRKKGKLAQFTNDFDGLNSQDVKKFVASYRKFPSAWDRCEIVAMDASLSDRPIKKIQQLSKWLHSMLPKANPKSKTSKPSRSNKLIINQVSINSAELYEWEQMTRCLSKHFKSLITNKRSDYVNIKHGALTLESFREVFPSLNSCFKYFKFPEFSWPGIVWKPKHDSELLVGVFFIGFGNWKLMFKEGLLRNLRDCEISSSVITKKLRARFQALADIISSTNIFYNLKNTDSSINDDVDLSEECGDEVDQNVDCKLNNKKKEKTIFSKLKKDEIMTKPSKPRSNKKSLQAIGTNTKIQHKKNNKSNLITQYMKSDSKNDNLKNESVSIHTKDMEKISELTLTNKMVDSCGALLKPVKDSISKLETLFKGRIYEEVNNSVDFKESLTNIGSCIDSSTEKCMVNKNVKIFRSSHIMKCALWNFVSRFTNATPLQLYSSYCDNRLG